MLLGPRKRVRDDARVRARARLGSEMELVVGQAGSFLGSCGLLPLKRPRFTISAPFKSHATLSMLCRMGYWQNGASAHLPQRKRDLLCFLHLSRPGTGRHSAGVVFAVKVAPCVLTPAK